MLEAARQALEVEWTETLAAAEAAEDHALMGYPSLVAYLKHRMGMAGSRANRYVKNARAANRYAATFSSWKHRHLSGDEAELMFRVSERMPDAYDAAESELLELVGDGFDDTRQFLDYWSKDIESPRRRLELEEQMERPPLSGESPVQWDGGRRVGPADHRGGNFPHRSGCTHAGSHRRRQSQRRPAAGRRSWRPGSSLPRRAPTVGGERPHLNIHLDLPALAGVSGGLHETEDRIVLDPILLDQLACNASVCRIVFGPGSEVLDVGRRTRVVPAATRRAVVARDRHCVAPGCDRPPRWCDLHHVEHWLLGGATEPGNLVLLCRHHHTMVHLGLLTVDPPRSRPKAPTQRSTEGASPLNQRVSVPVEGLAST